MTLLVILLATTKPSLSTGCLYLYSTITTLAMRYLVVYLWLRALCVAVGCWDGLVDDPAPSEVFKEVHARLALKEPKIRGARKLSNEGRISKLTYKLNRLPDEDGPHRLAKMMMTDLSTVFFCGRIDLEKRWQRYMVESKFTRRNSDPSKTFPAEERNLLATLYNWCTGDRDGWSRSRISLTRRSFAPVQTTRLEAIVSALSRSSNWPSHDDQALGNKVGFWKKSDRLLKFEEYQQAAKMTIKDPYNENYLRFASKIVISFSQALDLSFIHEESYPFFWKSLHAAADREELKPLIEFLQYFCTYFKNGNPFDNSFKYHQLVFETSSKIMNHLDKIAETASFTNNENDISMSSKIPGGHLNGEIEKFFVKAKLAMNYVEEFSHHVKQRGIISRFYPKPRATPAQIHHLAFLICDHMSPIHNLEEDFKIYPLHWELEYQNFPHPIQHDILGIMGNELASFGNWRETLIPSILDYHKKHSASVDDAYKKLEAVVSKMKSEANPSNFDPIKQQYDDYIYSTLSELEQLEVHPTTLEQFQNNISIWQEAQWVIPLEFSSISSDNAQKLILELKRGYQHYVMAQTNEREKGIVFTVMSHKIKELEENMAPAQWKKLKTIYELVKNTSSQTSYSLWIENIIEEFLDMKNDLAMMFDGILQDSSRAILAIKSNAVYHEPKIKILFEGIADGLLTTKSQKKLKDVIQLMTYQRIEREVPLMASMLIRGQISDFSTLNVGDALRTDRAQRTIKKI
ncbi:hypothetical protein PSHT_04181 [Puccinia striiformis]|uniref:Uncharacterized protein n=1 Tax=Puccinia striiformis TaxID=27350 RepID=A0A2S4WDK8_9BASI|nr:hypothetical protein PSHT_04181 [Puccinia striiformis]